MDRRKFIKMATPVSLLLAGGKWIDVDAEDLSSSYSRKKVLRFVVASDGHYGQKDTDYVSYYRNCIQRINELHREQPFDLTVINGDIIHDDPAFFTPAKQALDGLDMNYFVSQGNHDHCTREDWQQLWGMPVNHDFKVGKNSFLIATSSDHKGTYLCPDLDWMEATLDRHRSQENIFLFIHINPMGQTANAVQCAALTGILSKHKNIRAVFNGHDHDQDGIKMQGNIPFIFDAHFGGSWGTAYKGFRVVELLRDNSIATYIMDPVQRLNPFTLQKEKHTV